MTTEERYKIRDNYQKKWSKRLSSIDKKTKDIIKKIDVFDEKYERNNDYIFEVEKLYKDKKYTLLSEFFKKEYKDLAKAFANKHINEYYYIIDHMIDYPFTRGLYRRTVRSNDYSIWIGKAFELLIDYKILDFFGVSVSDYLKENFSEEIKEFKKYGFYNISYIRNAEFIIASCIDNDIDNVKEYIKEAIFGDNNVAIVTSDIIRGIVMSHDKEMHKYLCDYLLAARLQEGVRQAVCENADCGTKEAFKTIFSCICDNNLIRYAAIKRAVATWTGVCDLENVDRISNKLIESIKNSLYDINTAYEYIDSNDSVLIMVGLWTLGFENMDLAIDTMKKYEDSGTKNQLLTFGYYNLSFHINRFKSHMAVRIISSHPDDYAMAAVYMSTFMSDVSNIVYSINNKRNNDGTGQKINIASFYESKEQAYKFFEVMMNIYNNIPKKSLEFSPVVFPWYSASISKSCLIKCMAVTAYALEDNDLIDRVSVLLNGITVNGYYSSKSSYVQLLLHNPQTPTTRKCLIEAVADKESSTRDVAFSMVKELDLTKEEILILEGFMRYKTEGIRENLLKLLMKQSPSDLFETVKRLLTGKKEEIVNGALTIIMTIKDKKLWDDNEEDKKLYQELVSTIKDMENPTDNQRIVIESICSNKTGNKTLKKGYGLYDPDAELKLPEYKFNKEVIEQYFKITKRKLDNIYNKLVDFIKEHGDLEYKSVWGEECLLINGLRTSSNDYTLPLEDRYPFKELWIEFYKKYIKDPRILNIMYICNSRKVMSNANKNDIYKIHIKKILGSTISEYKKPSCEDFNYSIVNDVVMILHNIYPDESYINVQYEMFYYLIKELDIDDIWSDFKTENSYSDNEVSFFEISDRISTVTNTDLWTAIEDEQEFIKRFYILYAMDRRNDIAIKKRKALKKDNENKNRYYYNSDYKYDRSKRLGIFDYIRAYDLGIISKDIVYKAIFEYFKLESSLSSLSSLLVKKGTKKEETEKEKQRNKIAIEFFTKASDMIFDVEIKRSDFETEFSKDTLSIKRIYGIDKLVKLLKAMGNEKFDRSNYYWNRSSKKIVFSHLVKVVYPKETDKAEALKGLPEDRLIELVMYAPQWMDLVEEYLGYKGLRDGCYYFIAHMNEYFDDKRKAEIAKYTPLSVEELRDGAFDINWFKDAYNTLGEKLFYKIYDAAKYISDGSKHTRARKYADAALGKFNTKELEEKIDDKRNKDLLMSYGIIPIKDENDELNRYEFLQKFLKESKKFGAQRRASEALAVEIATKNLSVAAGYSDVTRLTLAMETKLAVNLKDMFEWKEVGEFLVKLDVAEKGGTKIAVKKGDKERKSIPAAIKKDDYVKELKLTQKKFKEQYSRTIKMFEKAMEDKEEYTCGELKNLLKNPVIAPVIRSLVYVTKNNKFWICEKDKFMEIGCSDEKNDSKKASLRKNTTIRIAHPFDMYEQGVWKNIQREMFEKMKSGDIVKQPFKQVFRELYIKLDEELEKFDSRMYAGYQIQPQKTVGCLKGRHWVADYDEGLQKIYYNENIVARIYALADWFSPADIEPPTLEWVEFSDRKTGKSIAIKDVPDIIYSEVMRDVDLAVSVAHVGGVDPETSHSTMEMRKAIIEFNMPLFGLENVECKDSHAYIEGKLEKYTVHLGSGVIHIYGRNMINILPVHSQSRGKIFLPFVDEDPKTSEILSKILLLAQDQKIKDPYILNQIK